MILAALERRGCPPGRARYEIRQSIRIALPHSAASPRIERRRPIICTTWDCTTSISWRRGLPHSVFVHDKGGRVPSVERRQLFSRRIRKASRLRLFKFLRRYFVPGAPCCSIGIERDVGVNTEFHGGMLF